MIRVEANKFEQINKIINNASDSITSILGYPATLYLNIQAHVPRNNAVLDKRADLIIDTVCDYFNIERADFIGSSRKIIYTEPRCLTYKLINEFIQPAPSLKNIGFKFSRRDHTTVINGLNRFKKLYSSSDDFKDEYHELHEQIEKKLQSSQNINKNDN